MAKRKDHALKQEDLIKAAYRIIAKYGVAAATVREVAREAGRSPGGLVHYLKSQDQLLLEVSDYSASLVRQRMEEIERKFGGLDALRRLFWEILPLDENGMGHWRVWFGFCERAARSAALGTVMKARYDESRGRFRRAIRNAQKQGEIPASINLDLAAEGAIGLIDGIGMQALISGRKFSAAKQRHHVESWIDGMLRPQKLHLK